TKKGAAPKWQNPAQYVQTLKQARFELMTAYDAAIKAYAADSAKDALRKEIVKEREALAVEQTETTAGPFRKGSVWKGTAQRNGTKNEDFTLEITALSGADFQATFQSKDGTSVNTVKGKFVRGNVEWTVSEVLKGGGIMSNAKATGAVRGNMLEAQMTNSTK